MTYFEPWPGTVQSLEQRCMNCNQEFQAHTNGVCPAEGEDMALPQSKLKTVEQTQVYGPRLMPNGDKIRATVRHDDTCGNGHNSFSVTGEIFERGRLVACGCLHNDIAAAFPELREAIKWHLCSTDGPLHYIANTIYWAEIAVGFRHNPYYGDYSQEEALQHARNCAVWPDAELSDLLHQPTLEARLPELMERFKELVESLGLEY